jgi:hypothetical protein
MQKTLTFPGAAGINTLPVYSTGWNGRDNGGVRGKTDADGDWVWPN